MILPAEEAVKSEIWPTLKKVLKSGTLEIHGDATTTESIPINVKVIVIGTIMFIDQNWRNPFDKKI